MAGPFLLSSTLFCEALTNGQPPEVVARQFYQARFVRPKVRPYRTNNYYAALMRQADAQEEVTRIVQKAQQRKARR